MKTAKHARKKNAYKPSPLTPEAQHRLIAYTAAASLGAFLGQSADGQVTQSQGLAPYPCIITNSASSNTFAVAFSIDGFATQFKFTSHNKAESNDWPVDYTKATYITYTPVFKDKTNSVDLYAMPVYNGKHYGADLTNWWATLGGKTNWGPATNWWLLRTNGVANTNTFILNPGGQEGTVPAPQKFHISGLTTPPAYGYPVPWTVGSVIDTNAWSPVYQQYGDVLANYWGADAHTNNAGANFANGGALGFTFWSMKSGTMNRYFGYMNIQITGNARPPGYTLIVSNIYYNATPNTAITVGGVSAPATVKVGSISVSGGTVTINFTSSDSAASSVFSLQKSTSLGASASWSAAGGSITGSGGSYQAVTSTSGGFLYYRIHHS